MNRPRRTVYDTQWRQNRSAGAATSAEVVVRLVLDAVPARRVVDLGCGLGTWLAEFRRQGVAEVRGVDGPWIDLDALQIPADSFVVSDLGGPLLMHERYDLAVSLEVGEHLDESLARRLVASLTDLAPVVLFSAAIPGQWGTHHVNPQWPDYWAERFDERAFVAVDYLRPQIWTDDAVRSFYRQNIALYVDRNRLEAYPALAECYRATGGALLSLVHPMQYDAVRSRPVLLLRDQLRARWGITAGRSGGLVRSVAEQWRSRRRAVTEADMATRTRCSTHHDVQEG